MRAGLVVTSSSLGQCRGSLQGLRHECRGLVEWYQGLPGQCKPIWRAENLVKLSLFGVQTWRAPRGGWRAVRRTCRPEKRPGRRTTTRSTSQPTHHQVNLTTNPPPTSHLLGSPTGCQCCGRQRSDCRAGCSISSLSQPSSSHRQAKSQDIFILTKNNNSRSVFINFD